MKKIKSQSKDIQGVVIRLIIFVGLLIVLSSVMDNKNPSGKQNTMNQREVEGLELSSTKLFE